MTQDEIIEMARQAKAIPMHKDFNQLALIGTENLNAFAKLVAEREREACAAICDELHESRVGKDNYFAFAANAIRELRAKQ
jgi:L-ascorbate metabolism protein UlaG (beta-lactamase superfamily)